ncbi:MAG: hypothetical protein ACXWCU_16485 [Caldimonas sp.]
MATAKTADKKRVSPRAGVGRSKASRPSTAAAEAASRASPVAAKKAAPVSASAGDAPIVGKSKPKLVRDSFTIPKAEYAVLAALKLRAASLARPTKKSEVLRAGIATLKAMSDGAFLAALNSVPSLKTGRPPAQPRKDGKK